MAINILQIMLIYTKFEEVVDPLLLPVNPTLTLGQLEEICQPVANVALRDREAAMSGGKRENEYCGNK